jgi:predicted nucleic acid-binding protein
VIFVDTGFFFALSATEEKERHRQARKLLETLEDRTLSDVLITTDHIVMETLTLVQTTVTRNAHARAVRVGQQLYSEKLARIYRTTFEEQLEAFAYLQKHEDKGYSAVDCLSFVVMLKLGIQEAWTFDDDFSHRFIARPGPPPRQAP